MAELLNPWPEFENNIEVTLKFVMIDANVFQEITGFIQSYDGVPMNGITFYKMQDSLAVDSVTSAINFKVVLRFIGGQWSLHPAFVEFMTTMEQNKSLVYSSTKVQAELMKWDPHYSQQFVRKTSAPEPVIPEPPVIVSEGPKVRKIRVRE